MDTILIFRIGSLGDTVVALPCFHRIAQSFPKSRRIVVTDIPASQKVSSVESVLAQSGLIDGVIYFPAPPRKAQDFWRLRTQIKATKATTLVYVADRAYGATLRDLAYFYMCGVRRIVGAPLAPDLRRLRIDPVTGHTEREAERLARCLAPLGTINLDDPGMWDLRLRPGERRAAEDSLAALGGREFAALSLGGKVASKDWGNDNWVALLELMARRHAHLAMVFIGSADEFDRSAALASRWIGPTLNLCGRLAPRESAAAMQRAQFYLGHDCGPMHMAAAVGIPCIAMFGEVNMPKWWHPMGPRHRILHDMRGVREIAPADVLSAIDGVMSEVPAQVLESRVGALA